MIKKFGPLKIILFAIGAFLILDFTVRLGFRIAVASLVVYGFLCSIKTIKGLFSKEVSDAPKDSYTASIEKSKADDKIREEIEQSIILSKKEEHIH